VDYSPLVGRSPAGAEVKALYEQAGLDLGADLARLAAAPRIAADPAAVSYLARFGDPSGALRRPLLTIHTTDDGRVVAGNEAAYAALVAGSGSPSDLRQLYVSRAGHCAFSDGEIIAGFRSLVARLGSGRWPNTSPAAMNHLAVAAPAALATTAPLGYAISGPPRFTTFTPARLPR